MAVPTPLNEFLYIAVGTGTGTVFITSQEFLKALLETGTVGTGTVRYK
jgi:hypothetical protein